MLAPYFQRLAAYNAWANDRLYRACAALPPAEYHGTRPSFFGSIHRTLNHILVADRHWLSRSREEPPLALALDAELYRDLEGLRAARVAEDEALAAHVASLDEATLRTPLTYRNIEGEPFTTPRDAVLQHVFNHQTHHRGQVHDMLSATAVPPPPLDLMHFVRERPDQAAASSSRP